MFLLAVPTIIGNSPVLFWNFWPDVPLGSTASGLTRPRTEPLSAGAPVPEQRVSRLRPPRFSFSDLHRRGGGWARGDGTGEGAGVFPQKRSPRRRAPWPAWCSKGCRRRRPEEEEAEEEEEEEEEGCWTDGGAKPGGGSERSCSPSRCALRGCCWGSWWGSSLWHRKQVRGPSKKQNKKHVFTSNDITQWIVKTHGVHGKFVGTTGTHRACHVLCF